jgi:hypothetical protein
MIMLIPYVWVGENRYRRLPWSVEMPMAEHAIRREAFRQTHSRLQIETVKKSDGSFVRDNKGDIILIDKNSHQRWGYIKEQRCQTLNLRTIL